MNTLHVGDAVEYVDERGHAHNALVTAVWGQNEFDVEKPEEGIPSINLVYVTDDESQTDSYGRQIARKTSIVYEHRQEAFGFFWRFLK